MFDLQCGAWGRVTTSVAIVGVVLVWYGINRVASGNYDALDVALLYVQVTGQRPPAGHRWPRTTPRTHTHKYIYIHTHTHTCTRLTTVDHTHTPHCPAAPPSTANEEDGQAGG